MNPPDRATQLLNLMSSGDTSVSTELMELIYSELHELARGHMLHERGDHTLQPTALVHEAFLKLVREPGASWETRRHFYSMASKVMRSLLVDHARKRHAEKRGGDRLRMPLDEDTPIARTGRESEDEVHVLDLNAALERLARFDEGLVNVVELRFFGGLKVRDISETLELPVRTVERRLKTANAWLREALVG